MNDGSCQFDNEKLQGLITVALEKISDKSMAEQLQSLVNIKGKHGRKLFNDGDQQFKQNIIEMYNKNPSSVTRILDLTREIDVKNLSKFFIIVIIMVLLKGLYLSN